MKQFLKFLAPLVLMFMSGFIFGEMFGSDRCAGLDVIVANYPIVEK